MKTKTQMAELAEKLRWAENVAEIEGERAIHYRNLWQNSERKMNAALKEMTELRKELANRQ